MTSRAVDRPSETSTWTYEKTLKDPDVEEKINFYWHRPLAFQLLRPVESWTRRPSPNTITIFSGIFGVASGIAAYASTSIGGVGLLLSAVLLFIAVILDCCDGMLARLTGQASEFGLVLDGAVDFIVAMAFGLGLSFAIVPTVEGNWALPTVIITFPSMIFHCAVYDHLKNRFVLLANAPKAPSEQSEKGRSNLFIRGAKALYENVYWGISYAISGVGELHERPDVSPERAREIMVKPMRMTAWMGLGTHFFCLYVSTALGVFYTGAPVLAAAILIAVLLNVWMLVVAVAWRRGERELLKAAAQAA